MTSAHRYSVKFYTFWQFVSVKVRIQGGSLATSDVTYFDVIMRNT
jgi:hypothetical protein